MTRAGIEEHAQAGCFGQFGEDLTIEAILRLHDRLEGGFFVDVGAFHPWLYSNTARLYLEHGWRGLHIDASAEAIELIEAARPHDRAVRALVGEHGAARDYVHFDHRGVNSADPGMIAQQTQGDSGHRPQRTEQLTEQTLASLVRPHLPSDGGPTLLSVDAEGMDLAVLRSNDWTAFRPFLVVVETHGLDLADPLAHPVARYLHDLDYSLDAHVFVTSVFRDTTAKSASELLHDRYAEAIWHSDRPLDAVRALAAHVIDSTDPRMQTGLRPALVLGQIAGDLRDERLADVALSRLDAQRSNGWARLVAARVEWMRGNTATARQMAVDDLPGEGMEPGMLNGWATLCARMGGDLLERWHERFEQTSHHAGYPLEWAWGASLSPQRLAHFTDLIAERSGIEPALADRCVEVMTAPHDGGPAPRREWLTWHAADATAPEWAEALHAQMRRALEDRQGFAYLRVGDGEGSFLAGRRPDLGGALGRDQNGGTESLNGSQYAELIERYRAALATVDVIGVAGLGGCASGPHESVVALSELVASGHPLGNVAAGAWHGHLGLEVHGIMAQLQPHVTGIIGPVSPGELPTSRVPPGARWLEVPGETHYYPATHRGASHWESAFPRIMEHPFAPGELWLVGAGILGKLYCERIRACGAVALDVGSLIDLWAGQQGTRGEFRENLWLVSQFQPLEQSVPGG